jgi:hypothetical protein
VLSGEISAAKKISDKIKAAKGRKQKGLRDTDMLMDVDSIDLIQVQELQQSKPVEAQIAVAGKPTQSKPAGTGARAIGGIDVDDLEMIFTDEEESDDDEDLRSRNAKGVVSKKKEVKSRESKNNEYLNVSSTKAQSHGSSSSSSSSAKSSSSSGGRQQSDNGSGNSINNLSWKSGAGAGSKASSTNNANSNNANSNVAESRMKTGNKVIQKLRQIRELQDLRDKEERDRRLKLLKPDALRQMLKEGNKSDRETARKHFEDNFVEMKRQMHKNSAGPHREYSSYGTKIQV